MIGNSGVGKSNITTRYTSDDFSDESKPTIGVSFATRATEIDGMRVRMQIWDTAGQERYRSLTGMYYRGALGAFIVYDITAEQSFNDVPKWFDELKRFCGGEEPIVMLVGNKLDMASVRAVSTEAAKELALKHSVYFMETSAKDSTNIDAAFETLAKEILSKKISIAKDDRKSPLQEGGSIILPTSDGRGSSAAQPNQGGCC